MYTVKICDPCLFPFPFSFWGKQGLFVFPQLFEELRNLSLELRTAVTSDAYLEVLLSWCWFNWFQFCYVRDPFHNGVCPAIQPAHTHRWAIANNSPCLSCYFCPHCLLSGDRLRLSLSYLMCPQLEVFPFMVTVVGPKQWQDVRPEYKHSKG